MILAPSVRVAGSLWSVPADRLDDEAARLSRAGLSTLHWDVSDGVFARSGGFTPQKAQKIAVAAGLGSEAHLMVEEPVDAVDPWTEFCDLVAVHVEVPGWAGAVDRILARGRTPALAVSPGTALSRVTAERFPVLVMSVEPGAGGSAAAPGVLERVSQLRGRSPLGVDGGVTASLGRAAVAVGADWVVSGTDLLRVEDARGWLSLVREAAVRPTAHGSVLGAPAEPLVPPAGRPYSLE